MVMPRRMGEGGRERERRKERGGRNTKSEDLRACREEDEWARMADATLAEQGLGCNLLTARLFTTWLKMVN